MASVVIHSNERAVTARLAKFGLSLEAKEQLLGIIGQGQLVSIRRTIRESGSPAGSWRPLSEVSRRWKKYSAGHKLLIDHGLLVNSVTFAVQGNSVVIGTSLRYGIVQHEGYSGPQSVRPYSYTRMRPLRGRGQIHTTDKAGKTRTVSVRQRGPANAMRVSVKGFTRHIHIPARPFVVFRPEDPQRIQEQVDAFAQTAAKQAGLEMN